MMCDNNTTTRETQTPWLPSMHSPKPDGPFHSHSRNFHHRVLNSSNHYNDVNVNVVINNDNKNQDRVKNNVRAASALGLRFNFNAGGPRLTRQRKLRHLTDQEVTPSNVIPPESESDTAVAAPSSRLSTSAPVPLPLPLPHPEGDMDNGYHSSSPSPVTRKGVDQLGIRPRRMAQPDLSKVECYRDIFGINVPTKSAPNSPFESPQTPSTNTADAMPYYYQMIAKVAQVCSAPELATLDMQGLPPPAFIDLPGDTSPLPSPPGKSPHPAIFRSPTVPHHSNAKFSARETIASLEVHPLPLPPAPTVLLPASTPQGIAKSESTSLKSQWQKGKLIGRGTFGSVYVASNRVSGALCAMKEVDIFFDDPKSAECIKQLEQEIKVLSHLKHQNIVQYYGSEIVEDHFYIYIEYVHPGSLNRYISEHCGAMTEDVVRSFTRHIVSGLAYLHSKKTIHRDIKGANLLVDAFGVVKLADFGMAKHLSGHSANLSLKGSPYWMAPELMQSVMKKDNSSDLALAVDIWSLGCTIIEMFTGKPPWSEYEGAAAMFKVMRDTPPIPESLSPEGKDFLRCCLRRNPAERSTANVLLEHRWLKNLQQLDVPSPTPLVTGMKLMNVEIKSGF